MSYHQLTLSERYQLFDLRIIHKRSLSAIAQKMERCKSTLSRELRRNQVKGQVKQRSADPNDPGSRPTLYLPDTAEQIGAVRRQKAKTAFSDVTEGFIQEVKQRLALYHSPEQITRRLKREGEETVSHETLYQMIYKDHQGLGQYQRYLRQHRGKRRQRGAVPSGRGQIPNRIGIEQRPDIAAAKTHVGHWESDTMVGKEHRGAVVILGEPRIDKASKFLLAGLAKDRTAQSVNQVTLALFGKLPEASCLTFACDNGKEFSSHEQLSQALNASRYPYHSWERGLNEHTNGLIRQFFPKGTDFTKIKTAQLAEVEQLINHRPRKSLDYRTPYEVFFSSTSGAVALQT